MSEFDVNSAEADLPSLPSLDGVQDPAVKKFLQAVKESIEIRAGQRPRAPQLDRAVTFRDLYKYQLATFRINGELVSNPNPDGAVNTPGTSTGGNSSGSNSDDLTIPGSPVEFVATGTKLSVLLEWQAASDNVAYTEIWRAEENNLALAVMVGATEASIYADIINEAGRTFYYWIRFVNRGGIAGNYNDDIGTEATTGQIGSAEILSMDGAKIIDATILNAKISSVSADKITTGILNATESISVGNSTSRVHIGGAGFIRSGGAVDYMNGSGWYFDNPDGQGRAFVGNGTYYLAWNGSSLAIEANNFSLTPSSFTFNGSGTFAGALNAATGTFAGALVAASGSFSGELIAATGTFGGSLLAGVIDMTQLEGFRQSYTSPGTYYYTIPEGKETVRISYCGASGGGGGGGNPSGGNVRGGGGGGGSAKVTVTTVTIPAGTELTIVVGAKGNGGGAGSSGGNGGNSVVTIPSGPSAGTYTANGGNGGGSGSSVSWTSAYGETTIGASGGAGGNGGNGGNNGSPGSSGVLYVYNYPTPSNYVNGVGGNGGTGQRVGGRGGNGGGGGSNGMDGYVVIESFNANAVVLQETFDELVSTLYAKGYLP
jgi:hypothetical protein